MTELRTLRPTPANVAIGFFIALLLFGAAHAAASPVAAASERNDVIALEVLAKTAPTADERKLAQGRVLDLRHRDRAALAILEPLARSHADNDVRATAYVAAANVYARQHRFADTYRAMEKAKTLGTVPLTLEQEQSMDMAKSLEAEQAMAVLKPAAGRLPVTRDIAGLMRVGVTVNGNAIDAVFDTGAAASTLSESAAKRLGVRILERGTTVGSSSRDALATHLGMADRVQFGDAVFTNMVFIVLPDSELTFGGGAYKIEAIVGLPLMDALHRIEIGKDGTGEFLVYGAKPGAPALGNLLLDGNVPLVLCEGDGNTPLRMFFDSGATNTMLNSSATRDFPALTATAVKSTASLTGAGGTKTDENAATLPVLHLTIAGRSFTASKVSVYSKFEPAHHGVIGQDVLKQGTRWVMDFDTMSFAVEN